MKLMSKKNLRGCYLAVLVYSQIDGAKYSSCSVQCRKSIDDRDNSGSMRELPRNENSPSRLSRNTPIIRQYNAGT